MTDSMQHRSTPVPSLEALERDVALADRRAARRTAIITSALALLVLAALLGAAYTLLKNLEEESDSEISTQAEAYNQDRSVYVSRDGYLVDNQTHRRIKPLVKDK
jgi:hypothetical protein